MRARFTGVGTALITPFREDGSVDEAAVKRLARRQIDAGIHFLVPCGTTGETPTLSEHEWLRVCELVVEEANGAVPVLAGCGSYNTREVIRLARDLERVGADGFLSVTPYYNKPTQEGLYQHFKAIAESTPLPIMLYSIQGRTGVNLNVDTVLRLAEIRNIVAIKEASGNVVQMAEIISQAPEDFLLLSGDDPLTVAVMAIGGRGLVSVASNEVPSEMTQMVELCERGDFAGARKLLHWLLPLIQVNFIESNPVPCKVAMAAMGLIEESYRLPLVQPASASRDKIMILSRGSSVVVVAGFSRTIHDSRFVIHDSRMEPVDPVYLTRSLVDIDSTTGREGAAGQWLAAFLRGRGYDVTEQPVSPGRFNVFARLDHDPLITFSTHFDCVPPFFPSRVERGLVFGRGACDAKGILAAQVAAAERLRDRGESRLALLFVVGEERGSDGAKVANERAPSGVRFLINGEPTDNRLGMATRGILRVRLRAAGRAAHSSFPELGDSAIDKLLDALMVVRGLQFPDHPVLGRTHYTVGLIEGGVAPNVVSPNASAELTFRTVADGQAVMDALKVVDGLVEVENLLEVDAVWMHTLDGYETAVFPYTTDVPLLTSWGRPLLTGPGSIHVAHTADEHLSIDELQHAVDLYASLATQLIR